LIEGRAYIPGEYSPDVQPTRATWLWGILGAKQVYLLDVRGPAEAKLAAALSPEAVVVDVENLPQNPPPDGDPPPAAP